MRAIAKTDYDLYVGHEFSPKGDPLVAMKAAYEKRTVALMDCCTNAIGKLFEGEGSIASITTRGGICTKYAEAKVGENCNGQATRITHLSLS